MMVIVLLSVLVCLQLTTPAIAQQQAVTGITVQLTCQQPGLADLTAASNTDVGQLSMEVGGRLAKICAGVVENHFVDWEVVDSNTLGFGIDSSMNAIRINRCLKKKIRKGRTTIPNGCNFVAVEPVIACTVSYDETVIVSTSDSNNLLNKLPGELVRPMRVFGIQLADVCSIDECDMNLWEVASTSLTGEDMFEFDVKDSNTGAALASCISSNTIKVRNWYNVDSIVLITTTTTTTTPHPYILHFSKTNTDWVILQRSVSCTDACANIGGSCQFDTMDNIPSEASFLLIVDDVQSSCGSISGGTNLYAPFTGYICRYAVSSENCGQSVSVYNRICCCGANCPYFD